jgi:1-acyl-sn-glycerol-3-phosphate acyltransferase
MTPPARSPVPCYRDPPAGAALVCLFAGLGLGQAYSIATRDRTPAETAPPGEAAAFVLGLAAGLIPAVCHWRGCRAVGFVPVGLTLAVLGMVWGYLTGSESLALTAVVAAGVGLFGGGFLRYLLRGLRQPAPGFGQPAFTVSIPRGDNRAMIAIAGLAVGCVLWNAARPEDYRAALPWILGAGAAMLVAFAWYRLFRPVFELCVEPVLWFGYNVRGAGPGVDAVPYHGPLLVVANHACWWDPLFLAKVLPRPVTPVMTAKFYDRWFLRPLMEYTFQVIRVPEAAVRREAPEIRDAIAALDAGKCVIIFPEGFLRRKEEQHLRRFGRGVWEILRARPDTPVLTCWIEGNWGSWTSYYNGPPTKNKTPQPRRPIGVGVSAPATVWPGVLENHLRTRVYLMNRVLAARAHLGLPELPPVELPARDEDETGEHPA